MADISRLAQLTAGMTRGISLSSNTLVVLSIKIGAGQTELTQTILDNLITLQNGSDAGSLHHHDGRYYTETELNNGQLDSRYFTETELSSTSVSQGASLIGIQDAGTLYTATNVETALAEVKGVADANTSDIADLRTTTGTADGATSMGTFTGSIIPDNVSTKAGMQALETDLEALQTASGIAAEATDFGTFTGATIPDASTAKGALQALETSLELKANDADVIKKNGSVAFTADQSMGGFKLTNLAAPIAASDAARLSDVQAASAGQFPKAPVVTVSTSNLTLSGEQTINGVLTSASRILVAGQTNTDENGIYVTAAGAWSRATDADGTPSSEIKVGNTVLVTDGTLINTVYILNASDAADPQAIAAGTESQSWLIYSRAESITASNGLVRVGNDLRLDSSSAGAGLGFAAGVLSVNVDDSGIEINADTLRLKDLGVTTAKLAATSVTAAKLGSDVAGTGLTGGNGSAIAINFGTSGSVAVSATSLASTANGLGASLIGIEDAGTLLTATTVEGALAEIQGNINALDAADIDYTPSTLADWNGSSDPGQTDDALDQLASRTKALENAGGNESVIESMVVGESFAANTLFCVRMAKAADAGFVAGRVYKAAKDATSNDNFHVIGMVYSGSALSAGDPVNVYKMGKFDLGAAHSLDIGQEHFLGDAGAVINGGSNGANAPTTAGHAVVSVCVARTANIVEVAIDRRFVN